MECVLFTEVTLGGEFDDEAWEALESIERKLGYRI